MSDSRRTKTRMIDGRVVAIVIAIVGVVAAGLVAAMPQDSLDLLVWRLWLPQLLSAATPPIGVTGRTLLAIAVMLPFAAVGAAVWLWRGRLSLPTFPAVRVKTPAVARAKVAEKAPSVRRADAHPDAPPRRPIRATEDLGPPLPIVTVSVTRGVPELEQPLPRNLDQRLAAFDPIAMPDVPRSPVRAVAPLVPTPPMAPSSLPASSIGEPQSEVAFAWAAEAAPVVEEPVLSFLAMAPEPVVPEAVAPEPVMPEPMSDVAPAEASEAEVQPATVVEDVAVATSVERPPLRRESVVDEGAPAPALAADSSISSLLDRLERGARKKIVAVEEPEKAESLDDTLVMLRRLAAR